MSNDLSNQLRLLNTFEWMARPATTKQICFDAADRIEKLEAALNCNLPDYDPKIGIVERLRQLGNWRVDGTKSSPIYNKSADHIEKLEAALREITWIATPDHEEARHKATEIARYALKEGKDD